MTTVLRHEKLAYFIIGVLSVLTWILLTGNAGVGPVGRYQMEPILQSNITHIYVIDTTTGIVKWVDKMNTPFETMKGE